MVTFFWRKRSTIKNEPDLKRVCVLLRYLISNLVWLLFVNKKFYKSRSQSYQTSVYFVFVFLLLSLSVCNIRKYYLNFKIAKLNSWKRKQSFFYEEKSLVGLTPGVNFTNILRTYLCQYSSAKRSSNLECKCKKGSLETFVQKSRM